MRRERGEGGREAVQCTPQHKAEQLTVLKRIKNLDTHTHNIRYNLFTMEISANSFDFDDLFPGSPEAGYFFPNIEKVFFKSIRTLIYLYNDLGGRCLSV
jgi:hypothetical protein